MLRRDYEGQVCSIARTLEIVGDRWTLLVIRDVVLGNHRFDQLLTSLGVASNVLTDRLTQRRDREAAPQHVIQGELERDHLRVQTPGACRNQRSLASRKGLYHH